MGGSILYYAQLGARWFGFIILGNTRLVLSHFSEVETEALRGEITCLSSYSSKKKKKKGKTVLVYVFVAPKSWFFFLGHIGNNCLGAPTMGLST